MRTRLALATKMHGASRNILRMGGRFIKFTNIGKVPLRTKSSNPSWIGLETTWGSGPHLELAMVGQKQFQRVKYLFPCLIEKLRNIQEIRDLRLTLRVFIKELAG